jgi:hypothetical protein
MKQIWDVQFINLEANGREIICPLLFFIQILTRKDWSWYLKWLYIWNEERNEVEESLLDIHKIEVRTILTREWILSNLGKLMQEYFLKKKYLFP